MKHSFNSKTLPSLFNVLFIICLWSCAGDTGDKNVIINGTPPQQQQQEQSTGDFEAIVTPVNLTVMNSLTSDNRVSIQNDNFRVRNRVTNGSVNQIYRQDIYNGRACPTVADDANGDGFIDAVEAQNRTGGVLIPLDSNINTQVGGRNTYPRSNARGNYNYTERGSLAAMIADLTSPDANTADDLAKLNPGDGINLDGAVIMIKGVPANVSLPATVAGLPGQTPQQGFPVACGRFQQAQPRPTNNNDDNDELSCRRQIQISCPTGQRDGCETGQTNVHRCVVPNDRSCTEDIAIVCPQGMIDGCRTGQTNTHRCVTPNALSCMLDIAILCPTGFVDGCSNGRTLVHRCVRQAQEEVSCDQEIQILCPAGFRDGCETGQTQVHRCVRNNQVACTEDLQLLCETGFRDGCETGQTTVHQCVRQEPGASCSQEIQILCPTGFHDGCTDGRTETHQCIRNVP